MLKFCNKNKGAISVFLTLILLPTFIFGGLIVDGSRILGAKNIIMGAGDLAMNAALSNYQEELNKTYGLLAMATTADEISDVMKDFFETTLNASGVSHEDFNKALVYLELTDNSFSVSNVTGTQIYETEVLKQEILEYMKYRAPVTLLDRALTDRLGDLKNAEKERKAADTQIKFESELDDMQSEFDKLKELADRQSEIYKSVKTEAELNSMLKSSKDTYNEISMLSVAYYRMMHCPDKKDGEVKALMEEMVGLSGGIGTIDAGTASRIIKMIIIENSMAGKNKNEVLEGLEKDSDEYKEMQKLIDDYDAALGDIDSGIEKTGARLDELVKNVYTPMNLQREAAVMGEENCIEIQEQMKKIKKKFEDLHEKYDNWKDAVNDLPEGESKSAYQENIEQVAGFFEAEGVIGEFEEKIENNRVFYKSVYEKLDQVTFTSWRIDKEVNSKAVFLDEADYGAIIEAGEITSAGKSFMNNYHDIGSMSLTTKNIDISSDEFVKQLKDFYCNTDGENKAEANKAADKWDSELEELMKQLEELLLTTDLEDLKVNTIGNGDLPTNWLGLNNYAGTGDENKVEANGGLKNKNDRKKASDSGSSNLNKDNAEISNMSSLADKIAIGGEAFAEPLMLTEYVMGMFSHNTSNKNTKGEDISAQSISRHDLSQNALYRAEIEYILWGNPNIRSNVGATKAIIFAVNFIFNMSFAFTNKTIRSDALTIANLFPVGALARTAIKCALQSMTALIETTRNLLDIMDGKAVPLLKSGSAWKTWIITQGGTPNENASGFTYEDYLWILVCIKMYIPSQQTELLGRTADCIELNMTEKKTKNDNSLHDEYTMVELEAVVAIDTFFIPRLNGAGYNVQAIDDDTFKIPYQGAQGY